MDIIDKEALIQKVVGAKVRELREASGLRALDLAAQAGISQSQLSKIETGKATISVKVLASLCEVLDRPLHYLFQTEEEVPRVLGTLTTVAGPESAGIAWFAREVGLRTGGRMSLIPLRAAQLGPPADQVEQLRIGVLDLFIEEVAHFARYAPAAALASLPYAFAGQEHLRAFLESPFFDTEVRGPLLRCGIRLMNPRWNWLRGIEWVLVATRPIVTPRDVRGLRVRIFDSPLQARFWQAMGARPVVVPWPDVKAALRDGEVDVVPTHKAHVYPLGFCRYARYVTLLGDVSQPLAVAVNERKYQALPPLIQRPIAAACDTAGDRFTALVRAAEDENERLNMARYNTAYLKVDIAPWQTEASRSREVVCEEGLLSKEAVLETKRPAVRAGEDAPEVARCS